MNDDKADREARRLVEDWIGGSNDDLRERIAIKLREFQKSPDVIATITVHE